MTLDDVFTVSPDKYLSRIEEIVVNYAYSGVWGFWGFNESGDFLFVDDIMRHLKKFAFDENELLFVFGDYEVGTRVSGLRELRIPYTEIQDILAIDVHNMGDYIDIKGVFCYM